MNTRIFTIGFLALLLVISSCREISVTTSINKDGSFTRQVIITGDSSSLYKSGLPYPIDDTWESKLSKDSTSDDKYILMYSKTYDDMQALSLELDTDSSWFKSLHRKTNISKQFGFFYSYLGFTEVYPAANPFKEIDQSIYVSKEDIAMLQDDFPLFTTADSSRKEIAEKNMENFLTQAICMEVVKGLTKGMEEVNNPALYPDLMTPYKDSLEAKVQDWGFDDPDQFIDFYEDWTGNTHFSSLHTIEPPIFEALNEKIKLIEKILMMEEYTQSVTMPGLITQTNSHRIQGNEVSWSVKPEAFLLTDYEMQVESRVINNWAFILTAIIVLLLIVTLFIRLRKNGLPN